MTLAFPYDFDASGRTETVSGDAHVLQMLEQLLFTSPGERVDRPDFGCGLLDLVFEPNAAALTTGLTAVVTAAIELWLGDVLDVHQVQVLAVDNQLTILLTYTVRAVVASSQPFAPRNQASFIIPVAS
jgi:uncharacterized protein